MATFNIGDRALFNDGQQVTITTIYNGGGAHGCYGVTSDTGAKFTAYAPELGTLTNPPAPARPLYPGECRTIVQYDTRHARQATPAQQQQARARRAGETVCVCPRYNFPHRRTVECEWLESDRAAGFYAEPNGAVGGPSPERAANAVNAMYRYLDSFSRSAL